jgi:hypothetical protein
VELVILGSGIWSLNVIFSKFWKVILQGVTASVEVGVWELITLESGACSFSDISLRLWKLLLQRAGSLGGIQEDFKSLG